MSGMVISPMFLSLTRRTKSNRTIVAIGRVELVYHYGVQREKNGQGRGLKMAALEKAENSWNSQKLE